MSQNPQDVTNPGVTNVADQGDGTTTVDQPVTVSPSSNPGPLVQSGTAVAGLGTTGPDQPVTVTPPMTAQETVEGGTYSPQSPVTDNVIENNVVGQVYGQGTPANIFV
jgi:hypothetical protein